MWRSLLIIAVLLLAEIKAQNVLQPMRCYQCKVEKNEDCTKEDYLKVCPTDQAYDVCMTSVVNNGKEFYIEKKCALGPCNLRDKKQNDGLGLDQCDRSRNMYSCFECCKGDGCNTNGSSKAATDGLLVAILFAAALYRCIAL